MFDRKAYMKEYELRPHVTARRKAYLSHPAQREKQRAKRAMPGYNENMKPVFRRSMLKTRYGITHYDYLGILELQGNCCAVCKTDIPGGGRSVYFDIDHNHDTGEVRGLLCRKCNVTLGVIERNRERIELLEQYIIERGGIPKGKVIA